MSSEIADVLERAADLIEPEGAWIQDDYSDSMFSDVPDIQKATCFCVTGAIAKVLKVSGSDGEEWAREHLRPLIDLDEEVSVIDWNDTPGRTQAEVVAKLREAAALACGETA